MSLYNFAKFTTRLFFSKWQNLCDNFALSKASRWRHLQGRARPVARTRTLRPRMRSSEAEDVSRICFTAAADVAQRARERKRDERALFSMRFHLLPAFISFLWLSSSLCFIALMPQQFRPRTFERIQRRRRHNGRVAEFCVARVTDKRHRRRPRTSITCNYLGFVRTLWLRGVRWRWPWQNPRELHHCWETSF